MALLTLPLTEQLSALQSRVAIAPLSRLAVAVAYTLMIWDERYRSRRAILEMTPDQLEDVGLSKSEALREAATPFYWSCRASEARKNDF